MNLVVNFLSMLVSDESNGSVKRMLGVCAEFERIAKVVLDKAEKDSHSRRKRKPENQNADSAATPLANGDTSARRQSQSAATPASTAQQFSPPYTGASNATPPTSGPFASIGNVYSPPPGLLGSDLPPMLSDYNTADFADVLGGSPDNEMGFDQQQQGHQQPNMASVNGMSAMNPGNFQQPFVPQDLWQMPMTLEWDWADMTAGPGFGN